MKRSSTAISPAPLQHSMTLSTKYHGTAKQVNGSSEAQKSFMMQGRMRCLSHVPAQLEHMPHHGQHTFGMCRTEALLPACCRTSSTAVCGSSSTNRACFSSCRQLLLALAAVVTASCCAVLGPGRAAAVAAVPPACCCRILLRLTGWLCRKPFRQTVVPWRGLGMGHSVVLGAVLCWAPACVLMVSCCCAGLLLVGERIFLCVSKVPAAREVMLTCCESWAREARASPLQQVGFEVQERWPSRGKDAAVMPQPSSSTVRLHEEMSAATKMLRAPACRLFSTSCDAALARSAAWAVERTVSVTCCGRRLMVDVVPDILEVNPGTQEPSRRALGHAASPRSRQANKSTAARAKTWNICEKRQRRVCVDGSSSEAPIIVRETVRT